GEISELMAEGGGHPGLVVRDERGYAVADMSRDHGGIVREPLRGVAIGPTVVLVLQRCRKVPVIQRRKRLNVTLEQAVDQPIIELQSPAVDGAVAGRLNPGPRDRKAIPLDAQSRDEVQVRFQAVVVIASHLAVGAIRGRTRAQAELIPDGGPLAVGARRAFDLESAARDAPEEILGKAGRQCFEGVGSVHRSTGWNSKEGFVALNSRRLWVRRSTRG